MVLHPLYLFVVAKARRYVLTRVPYLFLAQFPDEFDTLHDDGILAVKLLGQHDAVKDDEADVDGTADHLLAVVWLLGYEDVRTQTCDCLVATLYVFAETFLAGLYLFQTAK